jgi:hypothetical protein
VSDTRAHGDPLPTVEFYPAPGGTGVRVNGQELPEVRTVRFEQDAHSPAKVSVDLYMYPGVELRLPAEVDVRLLALQAGTTIEEREVDGVKHYRCVQTAE